MAEFTASAEGWAEDHGAQLSLHCHPQNEREPDLMQCSLDAVVESQPHLSDTLLNEHLTEITMILFGIFKKICLVKIKP